MSEKDSCLSPEQREMLAKFRTQLEGHGEAGAEGQP